MRERERGTRAREAVCQTGGGQNARQEDEEAGRLGETLNPPNDTAGMGLLREAGQGRYKAGLRRATAE